MLKKDKNTTEMAKVKIAKITVENTRWIQSKKGWIIESLTNDEATISAGDHCDQNDRDVLDRSEYVEIVINRGNLFLKEVANQRGLPNRKDQKGHAKIEKRGEYEV